MTRILKLGVEEDKSGQYAPKNVIKTYRSEMPKRKGFGSRQSAGGRAADR